MKSAATKTTSTRLAAGAVGLSLLLFGGYLNYAEIIGSLQNGFVDERIGSMLRAVEPSWFWYSFAFDAVISLGAVFAGAALMCFALRR